MYEALKNLICSDELSVIEKFEIPAQAARLAPIPKFLLQSKIGSHLQQHEERSENPLWAHQAESLEMLERGNNVVISTGTASGKSLIFQSFAFHKILLNADSRVLVFYPLKALVADQFYGWQKTAQALGLGKFAIARIDGSVPVKDREDILRKARIIVMTPDVCHAWMMSRLSTPMVSDFVQSLSLIVMDEAHSLDGVFGSNFAFVIRRLITVRKHLIQDKTKTLQFVAATATIKDPGDHLQQLTGSEFSVINHEADGSPRYERLIAHVACPLGSEFQVAKSLHEHMLNDGEDGGFITFVDSRKGVESLAIASRNRAGPWGVDELIVSSDVLPYRSGYNAEDREQIERRLRSGNLRGVVSTPALELGIDIPHLRVGFNVGIPATRKAYRQRLGRIGRNGPGAFVVIAPQNEFRSYGTTFRQYHEMSVEPSYLYLDNRFMQFAHARCLVGELESLHAPLKISSRTAWPDGFNEVFVAARPGGKRPPEYDAIAAIGGDSPNYGYPLRNFGEVNFKLKKHSNADSFGDINQVQALRECYPGAVYLHAGRAYKVAAWHTSSLDSFIRLNNTAPRRTRPRIRKWINAGVTATDILGRNYRKSEDGFLVECQMLITEKVVGYTDEYTGEFSSYRDIQQRDSNMCARSRNFRTTGVVLCIKKDWFKGTVKKAFTDKLHEVFIREYSIVPQDVGSAATNISVSGYDGDGGRDRCIVMYDETYGSLRLTERLYDKFEHISSRLKSAVEADLEDREDRENSINVAVSEIQSMVSGFADGYGGGHDIAKNAPTGYEHVFQKGSRVCYHQAGQMAIEVEIIQPTIMEGNLCYQVQVPQKLGQSPIKRWCNATCLEPSADADSWDYTCWNRASEEYEEPPSDDEES